MTNKQFDKDNGLDEEEVAIFFITDMMPEWRYQLYARGFYIHPWNGHDYVPYPDTMVALIAEHRWCDADTILSRLWDTPPRRPS
jgi:hypothetical protein